MNSGSRLPEDQYLAELCKLHSMHGNDISILELLSLAELNQQTDTQPAEFSPSTISPKAIFTTPIEATNVPPPGNPFIELADSENEDFENEDSESEESEDADSENPQKTWQEIAEECEGKGDDFNQAGDDEESLEQKPKIFMQAFNEYVKGYNVLLENQRIPTLEYMLSILYVLESAYKYETSKNDRSKYLELMRDYIEDIRKHNITSAFPEKHDKNLKELAGYKKTCKQSVHLNKRKCQEFSEEPSETKGPSKKPQPKQHQLKKKKLSKQSGKQELKKRVLSKQNLQEKSIETESPSSQPSFFSQDDGDHLNYIRDFLLDERQHDQALIQQHVVQQVPRLQQDLHRIRPPVVLSNPYVTQHQAALSQQRVLHQDPYFIGHEASPDRQYGTHAYNVPRYPATEHDPRLQFQQQYQQYRHDPQQQSVPSYYPQVPQQQSVPSYYPQVPQQQVVPPYYPRVPQQQSVQQRSYAPIQPRVQLPAPHLQLFRPQDQQQTQPMQQPPFQHRKKFF